MKLYKSYFLLFIAAGFSLTVVAQNLKPIRGTINQKYSEIKTWSYDLPNGARMVIRPDDSSSVIQIRAFSPGGALLFPQDDYASAVCAGDIIAAPFEKKDVASLHMTAGVDSRYATLTASCTAPELEKALQLIYSYFTDPKADKAAFNTKVARLKKEERLRLSLPENVLSDTLSAVCGQRRVTMAALQSANADRAFAIFKSLFGNAGNFTFVLTGKLSGTAFNESRKLNLISTYLGALPSKKDMSQELAKPNRSRSTFSTEGEQVLLKAIPQVPAGKIYRTVYAGNSPYATVKLIYHGNYEFSDSTDLQLKVMTYLLGQQLGSRAELKNATALLSIDRYPRRNFFITITYQCPPQELQSSIKDVQESIKNLQQHASPDVIKLYVTEQRQLLKKQFFNNGFWTDYLETKFKLGEDPYDIAHYPYYFRKATSLSIQQAVTDFLTTENCVQAVLLPTRMRRK